MTMRKNVFTTTMMLFGSAILFSACTKEEDTANKVTYQAKPANFSSSVGASVSGSGLAVDAGANSSITWTEGTLNIQEIDFEAKKDGSTIEYEYKQLVNVNLKNAGSSLGSVTIPDGTYNEVELKLELKKSSTSAIPVVLKGTYEDLSGASIPVEFQFNEDVEVKVEAEDLVVEANSHIAYINMQLNKLLSNISISDMTMASKTNGTIVISSTSNTALYNKLKASLDTFASCDFQ